MSYKVFGQLSLAGSASETSQAMSLDGGNACQLSMVISYIASSSAPTVVVQISNDGENWYDKATVTWPSTANAVGSYVQASPTTGLGAAFMRVKVTAGAAIILAIVANISQQ